MALADAQSMPDLRPMDTSSLSQRDAALARAMYRSAVTRWWSLTHLIAQHTNQPWRQLDEATKAALLAGSAQLVFLDGVATHAAVNETVAWIKQVQPRSSGIVNAVLRRVSEDIAFEDDQPVRRERWEQRRDELPLSKGGAIVLRGDLLPESMPDRLEAATGVPRWQVNRWIDEAGLKVAIACCAHSLIEPPIVLSTAFAKGELDPMLVPHDEPGHHVMPEPPANLRAWLDEHPGVWVQDASSSRAIADHAHLSPEIIVDLCAGHGTKTRQLAATFPKAQVIATDLDNRRRAILTRTFESDAQVHVIEPHELNPLIKESGGVDLVLADVPCSNSGVLARRAEARLRLGDAQLKRLVNQQRDIIAQCGSMLTPGGHLLYATCSLDADENREQALWAERAHGLKLTAERASWPTGELGAGGGELGAGAGELGTDGGEPSAAGVDEGGGSQGGAGEAQGGAGGAANYRDGAYWALLTRHG